MTTGVFWNDVFNGKEWDIIGNKFRNFPAAMSRQLKLPGVKLYIAEEVSEELLLKVHTRRFLDDLKRQWYCHGVMLSAGGCVAAAEKILSGEIDNALVFDVGAGHHAERDSAWGGTYASAAGPAFYNARQKLGHKRFAIIDTDSHHGNGTRDIFRNDNDVLHVCFCSTNTVEGNGTKICVDAGWRTTDAEYMDKVRREFVTRVRDFKPDMILHKFGHDTGQDDYGDRGLTPEFFPRLAQEIKQCADEVCAGRYLVLTHGGDRYDVAEQIFPRIIEILGGAE